MIQATFEGCRGFGQLRAGVVATFGFGRVTGLLGVISGAVLGRLLGAQQVAVEEAGKALTTDEH